MCWTRTNRTYLQLRTNVTMTYTRNITKLVNNCYLAECGQKLSISCTFRICVFKLHFWFIFMPHTWHSSILTLPTCTADTCTFILLFCVKTFPQCSQWYLLTLPTLWIVCRCRASTPLDVYTLPQMLHTFPVRPVWFRFTVPTFLCTSVSSLLLSCVLVEDCSFTAEVMLCCGCAFSRWNLIREWAYALPHSWQQIRFVNFFCKHVQLVYMYIESQNVIVNVICQHIVTIAQFRS